MITLLEKDVVIRHDDLNPLQGDFMQNTASVTGIDYLKQYIKKTTEIKAKKSGDKVYVLKSGTGSGKSSALPPALMDFGKKLVITEPTRMVVEETPFEIVRWNSDTFTFGVNIGYQNSVNKKVPTARNSLLFTTPGTLLQKILNTDPEEFVKRHSIILIDEVDKHSVVQDFLMAALKKLLDEYYEQDDCFILIVMSATLEPVKYMEYYDTTHYIEIKGKDSQPIEENYADNNIEDMKAYITKIVEDIEEKSGDVLIFLPAVGMIMKYKDHLETVSKKPVIALHSGTSNNKEVKQLSIVETKTGRIILATPAAETGITFPFLDYCIDSGLVNEVSYNPANSCVIVRIAPVTRASAQQRRGRVGRVRPGTWFPCYTEPVYKSIMLTEAYPEMYTADVTADLLNHLIFNTGGKLDYSYQLEFEKKEKPFEPSVDIQLIHNPPVEMIVYSLEKLYILGYVDPTDNWRPTRLGVLAGNLMTTFSLEIKRSIFTSFLICPKLTKYFIMIGACMVGRAGYFPILEDFGKESKLKINSPAVENDGFMKMAGIFQVIEYHINYNTGLDLGAVEDWFNKDRGEFVRMDIGQWLSIIELYHETVETLVKFGMKTENAYTDKSTTNFIWDLTPEEIISFKKCLYEGYKMNVLERKDNSYYHMHKKIELPFSAHPQVVEPYPKYLIINSLVYRGAPNGKMGFAITRADTISDISEIGIIDKYFI